MPFRLRSALLLAPAAVVLVLGGCGAAPAAAPDSRVVVRIAESKRVAPYEVHLAGATSDYATVHTMHPGETRAFAVPAGWLTVRIPGLCVIPTANRHVTTVDVDPGSCSIA